MKFPRFVSPGRRIPLSLAVALALSACANLSAPVPSTTAPATAAAAAVIAAPGAAPAPGTGASAPALPTGAAAPAGAGPSAGTPPAPQPFATVIKDAKQSDGMLPLWRKDEKVWLEIPAAMFDKPFMLSVNIADSIGEKGQYASQMGRSWAASFRRIGNQVQLIALNTSYIARNAPMKASVEQAFSHSLLASMAVASAPHPERKSVLVDAAFLFSDIAGTSTSLERAFRIPYALDRGNSFFERTRASADITALNTKLHFAIPKLPVPPVLPPGAPAPTSVPTPPTTTPDARSLFIGLVYSFSKLPETPMAVRFADPRLGHFTAPVTDFSDDLKSNPKLHHITRWRLEKKDPAAAMSEPVKPITFWLDKNIPVNYRQSVEAGILEWNKAFERIGFKNAIAANQQPDDADWDNMDAAHASVRWFVGADVGFAIGPSRSDPRTGEILDADIGMSDVFGRGSRRAIVEDIGRSALRGASHATHEGHEHCEYAHEAAAEMDFTLDILAARGDIEPGSPEAEAFVQAVIKDVIAHEVGHAIGLKHNFKASTTITQAQLRDPEFTAKHSLSSSVMDYNANNLSLAGERKADLVNHSLGAYDYWAVEYAYKVIPAQEEKAELARIAGRSSEPLLAYADDADAGGGTGNDGMDPLVNRFDLGDDPLAFYQRRLALSRELWTRAQERKPQVGDDPTRMRRGLTSGFRQLARASELIGKYVGGMHTLRDQPGTTGRPAYAPVDPGKQREALTFLATGIFAVDSFRFKPQFLASMTPDYNEWDRGGPANVPSMVLQMQTTALDRLLGAGTAGRLLDLPLYVSGPAKGLISLHEVYGTVQRSIWSELATGTEIDRMRRNLQREHLKRVQSLLTRGSSTLPADAVSLMRLHANDLRAQMQRAAGNGKLSIESRAHLQDSLASLTEALRASMTRS